MPGLGQLINGRSRLARRLAAPVLPLVLIAGLLLILNSPARLVASLVSPTAMSILLGLNAIVLVWRIVAVLHAFFDGRYAPKPGRVGTIGLVVLMAAVLAPHAVANAWGTAAQAAFASVFTSEPGSGSGPAAGTVDRGPGANERINILIVGVDSFPGRTETLTDSLMVVSVDPVGKTISMASMPRDLVGVPLGNGDTFSPKINSLMSYADRHKNQFPLGGMRTLENAIGALLGIPIHYYAKLDFTGFVNLVDAVGGVDINVTKAFYDPKYDGLGVNPPNVYGWGVEVGTHHFNGWEALAYARSRYAPGESDFTRAARQQEILLGIRDRVMSAGSLFTRLPDMFKALGTLVTTDVPTSRLPDLAALADDLKSSAIYRAVLNRPIVKTGGIDPVYGSVQIPVLDEILAVAKKLFSPPGETPMSWPPPDAPPDPSPLPS